MPYIKIDNRLRLDDALDNIGYVTAGELTYLVYQSLRRFCANAGFATYAVAIGCMVCAVLEFYRREVTLHEDKKIAENGDITK